MILTALALSLAVCTPQEPILAPYIDPVILDKGKAGAQSIGGFEDTAVADTPIIEREFRSPKGFYASREKAKPGPNGETPPTGTIEIYLPNFTDIGDVMNQWDDDLGYLTGGYVEGVLYGVLLHEYLHECQNSCGAELDCEHVAVYHTAYVLICAETTDCAELCTDPGLSLADRIECQKKVSGMCASLCVHAKWLNDNAGLVEICACSVPPPDVGPPGCNLLLPPCMPGGTVAPYSVTVDCPVCPPCIQ